MPDTFFGEAALLPPVERRARLVGVALAVLLALYHAPSYADSFGYGRDALYGALTHSLGIGPPPGEPLYILALNAVSLLFGFLPLAMATHCFGALVAGLAGFVLYQICRTAFGARPIVAACVVGVLNMHPMLGELFRPHDPTQLVWLFIALLLWAIIHGAKEGTGWQRSFMIALFTIGLFFGTTLGVSLLVPAIIIAYLPRIRSIFRRPHLWLMGLIVMLAGMTAWYYPMARAETATFIGSQIRPDTIGALRNYWAASAAGDSPVWALFVHPGPPLWAHLALTAIGFGPLGLLMLMGGWTHAPTQRRHLITLLAVTALLLIPSLSSNPAVRSWAKLIWLATTLFPLTILFQRAYRITPYLPLVIVTSFAAQQSLNAHYRFIDLESWINCTTSPAYAAEIYREDSRQWDFFCEELNSWYFQKSPAYQPLHGDSNPFTQIDGQLWPYATRRIALFVDGTMMPHFIMHKRLHGGFAEVWLLEKTETLRATMRPDRHEPEIVEGASAMLHQVWPAWEVFVFAAEGDALPVQPSGAYYERMADWQLGGTHFILWRLVPGELFGPDI